MDISVLEMSMDIYSLYINSSLMTMTYAWQPLNLPHPVNSDY